MFVGILQNIDPISGKQFQFAHENYIQTKDRIVITMFTVKYSQQMYLIIVTTPSLVRAGSPSRGGDVVVDVKDINQPILPTPFYSVLVSVSVFMAMYFIP